MRCVALKRADIYSENFAISGETLMAISGFDAEAFGSKPSRQMVGPGYKH